MSVTSILGIILISVAIISIISCLIYSLNNQKVKGIKYSFLNEFPNELKVKTKNSRITNILLFTFISVSIALAIVLPLRINDIELDPTLKYVTIFGVVTFILGALFFALINIVPPVFILMHTRIFLIMVTSLMLSNTIFGIVSFFSFYLLGNIKYLITLVIFAICALSLIVIMLNPKLITWTKLEKKKSVSDEIVYVRPKILSLAFSEWLSIIFLLLEIITIALFIIL